MTGIVLGSAEPTRLLSHLAAYGLAAIVEDSGAAGVVLSWTRGMNPRPWVATRDLDADAIATIVQQHAARHAGPDAWLWRDVPAAPGRGLMSPRISTIGDAQGWTDLQRARHEVLDQLVASDARLDQRLLQALGEPAYWRFDATGKPRQDEGASQLDMTPRNQGSELVGTRLRKLAAAVAKRDPEQVLDGLTGACVRDEAAGRDAQESRSANGLAPVGPVDNALAWCALWGVSQLPLALRGNGAAVTTGHVGRPGHGACYAPAWSSPWSLARVRTVLASEQLRTVAKAAVSRTDHDAPAGPADALTTDAARLWLRARGVLAVFTFPIGRHGSTKAPERRAERGRHHPLTPR